MFLFYFLGVAILLLQNQNSSIPYSNLVSRKTESDIAEGMADSSIPSLFADVHIFTKRQSDFTNDNCGLLQNKYSSARPHGGWELLTAFF
jgi:hypothetical protein